MPVDVTLTNYELMQAGIVGLMRRVSSIDGQMNKNKHADVSDWATDIDGAAAEMAMAHHLGVYWSGHVRSFKLPDVGQFQVRSTAHKRGCLIFRPNDQKNNANETYALVIAKPPVYSIIGLMLASEGMIDKYWEDGRGGQSGAWWVPQLDLPIKW